jgi:hypothetical protein
MYMSDNRFGIKEIADVWFYQLNEDGTKGEMRCRAE